MRRLPFLLLLVLALPAWALQQVKLQLNWQHQFQFAGYYAAIEKGYYRDVGLEVSLATAERGVDPIAAVLGGRAQFGIGASELVLRRSQGQPVVALAAILQHSPLVLIARQDKGLHDVRDLVGKRVMLMPHESELFAFLQRRGVGAKDIKVVPHSFDLRDLLEGRVDALSGYQTDELFLLEQAGLPISVFTPRSSNIDFYGDTLFTTEALLARNPDLVRNFRQASLLGWRYAMAHPEEIADLILAKYSRRHSREHLLFEAAEMDKLMQPELVEIGHMTPGHWRHIADTYAEVHMLPPQVSLDGFLYRPEQTQPNWIPLTFLGVALSLGLATAAAMRYHRLSRRLREDNTEREKLLVALNATQRDMIALIDAAPGAAILLDVEGNILTINTAGAFRFGSTKDAIVGHNIYDLSPPESRAGRSMAVARAVAEKSVVVTEDRRQERELRNTIVPVEDTDGIVRRVAVFSEDITNSRASERAMYDANERLLVQLAEIQALQARLAEAAIRDSLTGLFNRRYLDETLEREVSRARREGYPLSLVMVDIDNFKDINDTFGHQAGDEVLRSWARLLRADVRAEDLPCRYGGEEFLVLLPNMPLAAAAERAEDWRRTLAATDIPFGNFKLRCTASFGLAGYPQDGKEPDELTACADRALYVAKQRGRNRVEIYAATTA